MPKQLGHLNKKADLAVILGKLCVIAGPKAPFTLEINFKMTKFMQISFFHKKMSSVNKQLLKE